MHYLLKKKKGLGLSAVQVGILERFFIMHVRYLNYIKTYEFINPEIKELKGLIIEREEGCLSLPNVFVKKKRNSYLILDFVDRNNEKRTMEFQELYANIILHELDHINGILLID